MASWVFCNRCFQPPHRALGFSLTSCGHVYCDVCLRSGKRDECLICQVPCRTVLLSKHTDSDIQAFFGGIDGLCRKYARETSQVLEFQDKHRRRLFAFYAEKISSLEESLRESALQVEQLSRVRWSQQAAFSTIKDLVSTPAAQPACLPPDAAASERVESMEVDLSPSPRRKTEDSELTQETRVRLRQKPREGGGVRLRRPPPGRDSARPAMPEGAAGPARMSLLSPPRDGRMGSVARRPQHLGLPPQHPWQPQALRVPGLQTPSESPAPQAAGRAGTGAVPRQPLSISGLLQRRR